MHSAIRSWRKRVGDKLGEEDWQRGLASRMVKRIGETLGEEEKEKGKKFLIKSSNPHLAGGKKCQTLFIRRPQL